MQRRLLPCTHGHHPNRGHTRDRAANASFLASERRRDPAPARRGRRVDRSALPTSSASTSHTSRGSKPVSRDQPRSPDGDRRCPRGGTEPSLLPGIRPRLHDRFQAPMVEALLRDIDARWTARTRGPDPAPVTRRHRSRSHRRPSSVDHRLRGPIRAATTRAADPMEHGEGGWPRCAFTLRPTRGARHSVSRLLVLRSTEATREIARRYERTLATAFPAVSHDVVLALTTPSAPWPGSASCG